MTSNVLRPVWDGYEIRFYAKATPSATLQTRHSDHRVATLNSCVAILYDQTILKFFEKRVQNINKFFVKITQILFIIYPNFLKIF